eukprot:gene39808-48470_t
MTDELINSNPTIYEVSDLKGLYDLDNSDADTRDPFSSIEVFEALRNLNDPEHPLTLEQLNVITKENITVQDEENRIKVMYTPTIPHCSMATLIGLCIRVKLLRSLPNRFKVTVCITPGTHNSEEAINKQLNDKERVAAALENGHLSELVNKCLEGPAPQ